MLNKRFIIAFIIALLALIVVGFLAMHFVPTDDLLDVSISGNISNSTENTSLNVSDNPIDAELNATAVNASEEAEDIINNITLVNDTVDDANDTNSSSDSIDAGDVLHKQTFTISENETGQNEGMEPGKYVMYYTENDGIIKIEKIA